MEEKIEDLEFAIDNLDGVITTLSKYEEQNKNVTDLKMYLDALKYDLDESKEQQEELDEQEQKELEIENREREIEYMGSVI